MIARLRASVTVRHGVIVFAGVALANVFNYLYYMLIGRIAGIETLGTVTSLVATILVLAAPATVGQLIAARLTADLEARGDRAAIARLAATVMRWSIGAAVVLVLLGIVLRDWLAQFFHLSSSLPIVIAAVAFGFLAVVTVQRGVFQGAHRFGAYSATLLFDSIGKVVVGVSLVAWWGTAGALFGIAASMSLAFAYGLYEFRRSFGPPAPVPLALDRAVIGRVATHVGLGQLTFTVLMFYDVPIIKHAFDARDAGLYAAAALVGRAVLAATSFIPTLVMPKATARLAAGLSTRSLLATALGLACAVVAVAVCAGALAPQFVVTTIAGHAFGAAAPLVLPYTIATGALSLAYVAASYRMGLHSYAFVVPAAAVALLEVVTFSVWHPSLTAAIAVLLTGHLALLGITLVRGARIPRSASELVPARPRLLPGERQAP